MPVDQAGNASRPTGQIPVTGQGADAPQVNSPIDDIYAILNLLVFLDGRKGLRGDIPMNGYKASGAANGTDPQDYVTKAQLDASAASVQGWEPGDLKVTTTSSAARSGWLAANGQSVTRTAFPALWAAVQAGDNLAATQAAKTPGQYGPGDGSTTFTVPNLYADGGYFIRPLAPGRVIGSSQLDDNKSHDHGGFTGSGSGVTDPVYEPIVAPNARNAVELGFSGGNQTNGQRRLPVTVSPLSISSQGGLEARPKNIAYPVLIKT